MIRILTKADEKSVLEYLYNEPQINIFIIGDIENFGFDVDFQDIYGEFENNQYTSVLLRYRSNVIYYCHNEYFNTEWLPIIKDINTIANSLITFISIALFYFYIHIQPMNI
jgi:predicted GNAT family acetyltransferase